MKILLFIALVLTLQTYSKLVQVVSLSRHGARYHVYDYGNSSQTQSLNGELTAVGMRQLQNLGRTLRKQYIDTLGFLSSNLKPTEIQIFSTPVNRTQESITSLMNGLYPHGTGTQIPFVDKQWHLPPYSNKTDASEQNFALPNGHQIAKVKLNEKIALGYCPRFNEYVQMNLDRTADQVREMMTYYKPFMNRLAQMYNLSTDKTSNIKTFLDIYDVINVDQHLGRPMPPGFTDDDFKNLRHLANWYYDVALSGNNTITSVSGKIAKLFSVFQTRQKIPDSYALKWTFLSGHDTDVIALHLALNLSSYTCTQELYRKGSTTATNCEQGGNDFASNLIFELYTDDNTFFNVKVRSNGKYVKLCNKNSQICDYFTFKNSIKNYVVSNLNDICGRVISNQKTETSPQNEILEE